MVTYEKASTIDFLTGLCNRRQLLRLGLSLLTTAHRANVPLFIAMIDVDFFKQINDRYGHNAGDIVLKKLGELLQEQFKRHTDVIARYGGEEFCVLVSNMTVEQALELFENFRALVANTGIVLPSHCLNITVSIGISTQLSNNLDDMITAADHSMYKAKQRGRNCIMVN